MSIRKESMYAALNRANILIDYNIQNNVDKHHEFKRQIILADESLTNDEKSEALKILNKNFDYNKMVFNEGAKRICENCNQECLATLYCEHCVRNYLKANFSNWTSGNNEIDELIQKCQMEAIQPDMIPEWIPYNNLQNIQYLTKGGFSEIYTAEWIGGNYHQWDSEGMRLRRKFEFGVQCVVLKKLENVESANRSWLEEGRSHLKISNKWSVILQCYGLTKDPSSNNYMLVMNFMDMDLRTYLQQNHNKLTWKERINIAFNIILALSDIHREDSIHRDLHSGNILFSIIEQRIFISDLGFCGPADKSLNSIYGNLPYIAPEVIVGKETTKASDIYSFGILMWEISSGQPPFVDHEHNYDLAMKIVNGMRPKRVPETPLEYRELMEQCWDADLTKRPDTNTLEIKMRDLTRLYFENKMQMSFISVPSINNSFISSNYSSKIHQFTNLPEPRNATEEEQEAFHSTKYYDFSIPNNIEDFNSKYNNKSKSSIFFKNTSKKLSSVFKKLQIHSNNSDIQNNYQKEIIQQEIKKYNFNDHEDLIYDNPNLHSEEQDELEIPDDI